MRHHSLYAALAIAMHGVSLTVSAQTLQSKEKNPPATTVATHLTIAAAIVMPDLSVRPLAAFPLVLISVADSTQRVTLTTTLDGTVVRDIAAGKYLVRSVRPAVVNDSSYEWSVEVEIAGASARAELTNANASVSYHARALARQVAPERDVFERVRRGVFRMEAGLATGSGFLVQVPGVAYPLVLTNDHVVVNDTVATIYLDSITRVTAIVVARDRDADLALLRIASSRVADRPILPFAAPNDGEPLVVSGERVLAIGFPLHQQMTLTTGIVSSVRDGAIISDVNINHGNSGGPMLNLAGEVVGVNAFGDFSSEGGPGISGAISIKRLEKLAAAAPAAAQRTPEPSAELLPFRPLLTYPTEALKQAADTVDPRSYRKLLSRGADHFQLTITTPVMYRVQQRLFEAEVGEERKKRESAAGVTKDQSYSETKQSRDWEQYVGDGNTPVITIAIAPRITETGGSAFLRGLAATQGVLAQASFVFDGDVRGAHFYRNGIEVQPIFGGHGPLVQNVENAYVKLKDVADYGYYVLPPELFAPDSDGTPARVRIAIADLKRPYETSGTEFVNEASARVWNDFRAYYQAVAPDRPFTAAIDYAKSRPAKMICEAGACQLAH